jgi:uncharacterized protein (TIGR02186 family)
MPAAQAQTLVADLSNHLVRITAGFTGAEVLLFGATDGQSDVIVVVRGPDETAIVRRKSRIAGIWVNAERMIFPRMPSFYHVAASRPLQAVAQADVLASEAIGAENLRFEPTGRAASNPAKVADYGAAFLRTKRQAKLYQSDVGTVRFLGDRLFRTTVRLPANVPTGTYNVQVFQLREGRVINTTATPLIVGKDGVGADVYEFAHRHAAAYGIIAIIVALMAGWLTGVLFRKV